jgi:2-methylcitrate dehydratase PrpD
LEVIAMDADAANSIRGLTKRLAEFAVSFRLKDAPPAVLENAKLAMLDCLGVSVLAARQEIGGAIARFADANAAPGRCVVWGTGITTSPRDAALMNATLAHGLDYDDRNHSSTYSLAAPMAVAEDRDLPGARLLEGFIVGREIRNSLDAMFAKRGSGIGPGAKGWHSNGVLGPIAAAGAVARTLDLDVATTLAALGLATASSGALTRDGGTMAKPFRTGHAAQTGLTCVLLAMSGFSSDDTALEGRYGYLEALGPLSDDILASVGRDLGKTYNLAKPIRGKRMASCSASHAGIEAMLALLRDNTIKPADVESIDCDLKPYPLVRQVPARGYEGRFSMPFCLAITLVHGDVRAGDFSDATVADPVIQDLIRRTRHSDSGTLVVTLKDGRRLEAPLGPPTDFTTRPEIEAKFHDCVDGILPKAKADTIVSHMRDLEFLGSVRELAQVLAV